MSFSPEEQAVVEGVSALLTRYVTAYVHADKAGFSSCFHKDVSMAAGDTFLSRTDLREQREGAPHYFDTRVGHWSPPLRTTLSVSPINRVAALGKVRWMYPATSTGLEYLNVSLYLCVLAGGEWKILMVTTPTEAGEELVTGPRIHLSWDVPRWPIHRQP
ncbi:MAG TPA: hypothetical protein VLQ45_24540 [Thermoanaerobaculia bacterium]|nr:hypothetical protein [Thermoanaerobaculia bacterium]